MNRDRSAREQLGIGRVGCQEDGIRQWRGRQIARIVADQQNRAAAQPAHRFRAFPVKRTGVENG